MDGCPDHARQAKKKERDGEAVAEPWAHQMVMVRVRRSCSDRRNHQQKEERGPNEEPIPHLAVIFTLLISAQFDLLGRYVAAFSC